VHCLSGVRDVIISLHRKPLYKILVWLHEVAQ